MPNLLGKKNVMPGPTLLILKYAKFMLANTGATLIHSEVFKQSE